MSLDMMEGTVDEDRMQASAVEAKGDFRSFAATVEKRFRHMARGELYEVDAGDMFEAYLGSFPAGSNPIFRERTEHDCSCCKNFVRNIGNVVSIEGGAIGTVWDVVGLEYPYNVVAKTLADRVRQLPIVSVYRTKEGAYGAEKTRELRDGATRQWHHFFCHIERQHRSQMPDRDRGAINTAAQVFRRGLEELTLQSIETVLDLIGSNSLYRGAEHKRSVDEFVALKRAYEVAADKNLFAWADVNNPAARFRNTVIGTLVTDLSAGVPLEDAVRMFESKVAPQNYKRTTALITPKMIDNAVAELKALGLETAVERRYAKLSDVSVNNVLFVDNSVKGQMKDGLAGLLMEGVKPAVIDVKNAEPISVGDFISTVVPQASSIDLLLKNKHLGNFVSVTAPVHADAGQLFKWNNGFAWSYDGDVTDSIKERVKRAGGNVNAKLRVSLSWFNYDDLDLHVIEPSGRHVFFGDKCGILDVDMNAGSGHTREPVENLAWSGRLADGLYRVYVNNYSKRENTDVGFALEYEFAGDISQFKFERAVGQSVNVDCLRITVQSGIVTKLDVSNELIAGNASAEKWGVNTETLVPVDTLLASPNHWDGQEIGNKHWFFILKGCKNPGSTRGIYNEFLRSDFEQHRKVFEVLGAKTKCPPADDQLSGVGFSSTRSDEATVIVKGNRINKAFNIQV